MISETEYVEQQKSLGRKIHFHDGVYWEQVHPSYCKPAFAYKVVNRGSARPKRFKSLLGYSHCIDKREDANRIVKYMALDREILDSFELTSLPSKKRNQVRRALDFCCVAPITDLECELEGIREINIAQATRQENGAGAETPVQRFVVEAEEWRAQMRREFTLYGREWWGAFHDKTLIAYMKTFQVDNVRIIMQVKTDIAYQNFRGVDALYYFILVRSAADKTCHQIFNGSPLHQTLNHFKEQFLFQAKEIPHYYSNAWLVNLGKRIFYSRNKLCLI